MLQLQEAGLSLEKFVDAEFSVQQLKQAGPLSSDLIGRGFSLHELEKAKFSAQELKDANMTVKDLEVVGFSVMQLKPLFSLHQLRAANFSAHELRAEKFFCARAPRGRLQRATNQRCRPRRTKECRVHCRRAQGSKLLRARS